MRAGSLRGAAAALTLVALGALLFPRALRPWVTAGSVVVFAAAAAAALGRARALRSTAVSPFDDLEPAEAEVQRPADLARLERMLGWRQYSQEDFHHRVAPVLTRILTSRLSARGVDAHAHPDLARRIGGPELAPLLDPAAGAEGRVVDTAAIARMVDAIEAL